MVQLHGGAGVTNPVRQIQFQESPHPLPAGGGSVTYKSFEHTFMASCDHSVSDPYGLGATSNTTAGFSWQWRRPGRRWWIESTLGWQQLEGNFVGNTSGWRTMAGVGRQVGAHAALLTQYAYLNYSGLLQRAAYGVDQSAVRVSLTWSPRPELMR